MKNCKECGTKHSNHSPDGNLQDTCYKCQFLISSLLASVEGLNRFDFLGQGNGGRQIEVSYKIKKT